MKKVYISEDVSYEIQRKKFITGVTKFIVQVARQMPPSDKFEVKEIYDSKFVVIKTPTNEYELVLKAALPTIKNFIVTGKDIQRYFIDLYKLGLDDLKQIYYTHYKQSNDNDKADSDEKMGRV